MTDARILRYVRCMHCSSKGLNVYRELKAERTCISTISTPESLHFHTLVNHMLTLQVIRISLCQCPTPPFYFPLPLLDPPRIRRRSGNASTHGARTSLDLEASRKAAVGQDAADSGILDCFCVLTAARVAICVAAGASGGGGDAGDLWDVG
jgi:hypothetical protein